MASSRIMAAGPAATGTRRLAGPRREAQDELGCGENKGSPGPRAHQRARYVLRCARPLKPATVLFEGDDPRAYIIASNISRRHLTKGQQAMAVAMVYPVPEKGGKGKRSRIQEVLDEPRKTFQNRLSQARIVFAYSPDLAQAVL